MFVFKVAYNFNYTTFKELALRFQYYNPTTFNFSEKLKQNYKQLLIVNGDVFLEVNLEAMKFYKDLGNNEARAQDPPLTVLVKGCRARVRLYDAGSAPPEFKNALDFCKVFSSI